MTYVGPQAAASLIIGIMFIVIGAIIVWMTFWPDEEERPPLTDDEPGSLPTNTGPLPTCPNCKAIPFEFPPMGFQDPIYQTRGKIKCSECRGFYPAADWYKDEPEWLAQQRGE